MIKQTAGMAVLLLVLVDCLQVQNRWDSEWECRVFPAEHEITLDPESGAKLIFATTHQNKDVNFYFDLNSWFRDLSMMAFYSDRSGRYELFGYLTGTGEIVKLQNEDTLPAVNATVDNESHDLYVVRGNDIFQWQVSLSSPEKSSRSTVHIRERKIVAAPPNTRFFMGLTESADGRFLSSGLSYMDDGRQDIVMITIKTGEMKTLLTRPGNISHVQFSKYNPDLLRFSSAPHRMWMIDIRKREAIPLHDQEPGELVTHEDWWVDDQMTFCGGYREEESHVKIMDIHSGVTRIIGAGSWWETGTPFELSRVNWWHASGSRDGRFVAADNWHGDIAVILASNTRLRLITRGHRPYGDVRTEHPHVGWAPDSRSVEFTSHKKGNCDVVIAFIPQEWMEAGKDSVTGLN